MQDPEDIRQCCCASSCNTVYSLNCNCDVVSVCDTLALSPGNGIATCGYNQEDGTALESVVPPQVRFVSERIVGKES